ncbi:hypothetical protein KR222_009564, partial [Zaprionus bogoriensis]
PELRSLAAFDFDQTIIQNDSYLAVSRLLTQEISHECPDETGANCWMLYIRRVLKMLLHQEQLNAQHIGEKVRCLAAVPGMMRLIRQLAMVPGMEMCIMSDANCFFITEWLDAHGIGDIFKRVYTNPSSIQEQGELIVHPYEQQTACRLCPVNLCKGGIMRGLMRCTCYGRIIYVGDGGNDLCPILQLRAGDVACVRRGFELHGRLPAYRKRLRCQVFSWRDGHELMEKLATLNIF